MTLFLFLLTIFQMNDIHSELLQVAEEIEIGHEEILPGGIGESDSIARQNGVGILHSKFLCLSV